MTQSAQQASERGQAGDPMHGQGSAIVLFAAFTVLGQALLVGLSAVRGIHPLHPVAFSPFFIGATQLVYVVPLVIWALVTRRRVWRHTFLLLAGLVMLANASCLGLVGFFR